MRRFPGMLRCLLIGAFAFWLCGCADTATSGEEITSLEVELEVHMVRSEDECSDCVPVHLPNLYTRTADFLIGPTPQLHLERAQYVEPVLVKGGYPREEVWRLRIDLPADRMSDLRAFRSASESSRQPILISVNGHPVDVITVGGLASVLIIGAFDTAGQLKQVVGRDDGAPVVEVTLNNDVGEEFAGMERQLKNEEQKQELVDELLNALQAGDSESAKRIQKELAASP
jgi:uncharacterized lipoprotein YmbA